MSKKSKAYRDLARDLAAMAAERAALSREEVVAKLGALSQELASECSEDDLYISSEVDALLNEIGVWWNVYQQLPEPEEQ